MSDSGLSSNQGNPSPRLFDGHFSPAIPPRERIFWIITDRVEAAFPNPIWTRSSKQRITIRPQTTRGLDSGYQFRHCSRTRSLLSSPGPRRRLPCCAWARDLFITFTIAGELACSRSATPIATATTPLLPIAGDVRLILMKVNDCVHHELVPASKLVEMVQVIHEQTPEAQALRQHLLQQSHGVLNEEDDLSLELALADSRRMDR